MCHLGPPGWKWQKESEMSSRTLSAAGAREVQNGVERESEKLKSLGHFGQKSLGVHKNLICKIWLYPPPPKGPTMRNNCTNQYKILKIDTSSGGGEGETRFYGQIDFMDI